ncbi:hypothetical protein CERSUDRAFT_106500 [Gelatoporia subvermispora B]|uniref:ASX DEUBAD domain-containing protein n=1 Tax=Ceriporiopsis subvermispora (strain B) TaxID=914234 RepID=M2RAH3_CERS8|nr:hypothetical protein CERSUDRAFT_106500 [Gelatoporia subvermispora B]
MDDSATATSRPRRTARPSAKVAAAATPSSSASNTPRKRKVQDPEKTSTNKLEYLLTNPKSKLTQLDISDALNYSNFLDLSQESQDSLVSLLPPTAFTTHQSTVSPTHVDHPAAESAENCAQTSAGPSNTGNMVQECTTATLEPAVFTSAHFLSAAHTFQDHLYSGWLTQKAADDIARFEEGVRAGTMHAEWKDEEWDAEHEQKTSAGKGKKAGPANLALLAQHDVVKEGDVLSYRREFPHLQITVEKDMLVQSINPRTHALTVHLLPATAQSLPTAVLVAGQEAPVANMLAIEDVSDPEELEAGVLDVDGRVGPGERSHPRPESFKPTAGLVTATIEVPQTQVIPTARIRAWKAFTVWRWRDEMRDAVDLQIVQERGGRERVGTLYYLREHSYG